MLSEIPLSSPRDNQRVRTPHEMEDVEWKTQYKQVLSTAQERLDMLAQDAEWRVVPDCATSRLRMYTAHGKHSQTFVYKMTGELKCDARQVVRIHDDLDYVTRSQWDGEELQSLNLRETYTTQKDGTFCVFDATVGFDRWWFAFMGRPYYLRAVQVSREYPMTGKFRSTVCSCDHRFLAPPKGHSLLNLMMDLQVQQLEPTPSEPNRCLVRILVKVMPETAPVWVIQRYYNVYLQNLLSRYERVATHQWDEFYGKEAQEKRERERRNGLDPSNRLDPGKEVSVGS